MHKKTQRRWPKNLGFFCLLLLVLGLAGSLLLSFNPRAAATITDTILRPLLGDKLVISLERVVFSTQDKFNQLQAKAPDSSNYTSSQIITPPPQPGKIAAPTPTPVFTPTNITPYIDQNNPLPNEGVWKDIANNTIFRTFLRTDPERPYSVVNLAYMPMRNLSLGAVAGKKHPGGISGISGPGMVPSHIQSSGTLIAAFNGGFLEKDGHYGMYANGVTYMPLRKNLPALFIYQDGHAELSLYNGTIASNVMVARQNGPYLVENSQTNKITSKGIDLWAGTAAGGYITWRSGVGLTPSSDLIYAVGPSLTPTSLAEALRLAGCQEAIQLDINNTWTRFMLFNWNGNSYQWSTLIDGLTDSGQAYLNGNDKDFFYLYKK